MRQQLREAPGPRCSEQAPLSPSAAAGTWICCVAGEIPGDGAVLRHFPEHFLLSAVIPVLQFLPGAMTPMLRVRSRHLPARIPGDAAPASRAPGAAPEVWSEPSPGCFSLRWASVKTLPGERSFDLLSSSGAAGIPHSARGKLR